VAANIPLPQDFGTKKNVCATNKKNLSFSRLANHAYLQNKEIFQS
jgi:hypothetical protein